MKYTDLQNSITAPVFSQQDLKLLGAKLFPYQFSLWQKQGYLIKLKNGLYAFHNRLAELEPEEISGLLYSPGYLSLEKALSYYGFIPEMVYALTLVTPKTTRKFKNILGTYNYHHIKSSLFFGYRQVKGNYFPYLLAEPEKALLDYIYMNLKKLKTKSDIQELRLNQAALSKTVSIPKLNKYLAAYKNKEMSKLCRQIMEGINA